MRCGILTLSDKGAKGEREDLSGRYLKALLEERGWEVSHYQVLPDEKEAIVDLLKSWCDDFKLDLILTTGGTGVHPRDVTPEATKEILDKEIPGISEYIRYLSFAQTQRAALSRGVSGSRKGTLIINLPGSPRALKEIMPQLLEVIEHGVNKIKGDPGECARD
jgi:molybdenum cofactor synthesis domain-containing protein